MKPVIYLVEDDETIVFGIKSYLSQKNFVIYSAASASEAKMSMEQKLPSLVILDWNLKDGSGDVLCRWIREKWNDLPVIFLTVRGDTKNIVKGFQVGADDYIVKPFDLEILYSRICAILRRTGNKEDGLLTCGMITLDKNRIQVFCEKDEIPLSAMEYQLLLVLMENKNHTLTRNRLLEIIWDANGNFVNDNTLTVTMKRLREKLHNPPCLKTIRSFGYRMEDVL